MEGQIAPEAQAGPSPEEGLQVALEAIGQSNLMQNPQVAQAFQGLVQALASAGGPPQAEPVAPAQVQRDPNAGAGTTQVL